jgi:zinc and cadmium transporter
MQTIQALIAVVIVSLVSFVGVVVLLFSKEKLKKITLFFVSLSAGTLLGGAFIHLMPEIVEEFPEEENIWFWFLGGLLFFFVLEKVVCWRHCHIPTSKKHPHKIGLMNLTGDLFHNFVDGMAIAGSFLISTEVGIVTTVAVILHEIPQEIADFGILIYAKYSIKKALVFNFITALASVFGAGVVLLVNTSLDDVFIWLLPFTAGGFTYIATSDLIPELQKETGWKKSLIQFLLIFGGISLMWGIKLSFE